MRNGVFAHISLKCNFYYTAEIFIANIFYDNDNLIPTRYGHNVQFVYSTLKQAKVAERNKTTTK